MRVERIQAKQGHPVPKVAHSPMGPFPRELFASPEVVTEYEPEGDDIPEGATAQNNYRGVRHFRCRDCGLVLTENETYDHVCDYEDEE